MVYITRTPVMFHIFFIIII